jgi:hypothetical protein
MLGMLRSSSVRRAAVTLYALAVVLGVFAAALHRHSLSGQQGVGVLSAQNVFCQDQQNDPGAPAEPFTSCCDACLLTAPPTLPSAITHIIYRLEISTRFEFAARLGRDLDQSPDDLRSRAPPVVA